MGKKMDQDEEQETILRQLITREVSEYAAESDVKLDKDVKSEMVDVVLAICMQPVTLLVENLVENEFQVAGLVDPEDDSDDDPDNDDPDDPDNESD